MCVGLRTTTLLPKPNLPPLQNRKVETPETPTKPEIVSNNKESYSKEKREQNLVRTENSKSASFAPVTSLFKPLVVKTTLGDRLQTLMNVADKQTPVTTSKKTNENGKTTWESSTKTEYKEKGAEKAKATHEKKYAKVFDKNTNSGEVSRKTEVKDAEGKTVLSHDTKATGSMKAGETQGGLGHTRTEGDSKVLVQGGVKYTVAKPVAKGDVFAVTWTVEVSAKAGRSKDTEVKNPNAAPEDNKKTKGSEVSVGVTHTEKMTRTFKTQKEAMDFYRSNSMIPKPGFNKSDPLSMEVGESKSSANEVKGTFGTNTKSSPKTFGDAINTGKKFNISGKMQVEISRPSKDIIEFEVMSIRGLSADTTADKSKNESGVDDKNQIRAK